MQPRDVVSGCMYAYLGGLAPHVMIIAVISVGEPIMAFVGLSAFVAFVGAVFAGFAGLVAFAFFSTLKARQARVVWWAVPMITIGVAILLLSPALIYAQETLLILGYCIGMGMITGVCFWIGAVGRHRAISLGAPPVPARPDGLG